MASQQSQASPNRLRCDKCTFVAEGRSQGEAIDQMVRHQVRQHSKSYAGTETPGAERPSKAMEPVPCGYCPYMITQEEVDAGSIVATKVDSDFGLVHRACYDNEVVKARSISVPGRMFHLRAQPGQPCEGSFHGVHAFKARLDAELGPSWVSRATRENIP